MVNHGIVEHSSQIWSQKSLYNDTDQTPIAKHTCTFLVANLLTIGWWLQPWLVISTTKWSDSMPFLGSLPPVRQESQDRFVEGGGCWLFTIRNYTKVTYIHSTQNYRQRLTINRLWFTIKYWDGIWISTSHYIVHVGVSHELKLECLSSSQLVYQYKSIAHHIVAHLVKRFWPDTIICGLSPAQVCCSGHMFVVLKTLILLHH